MRAKIVLLLVLAIIVNSCSKSDFGTRPTLSLVSVSTTKLLNDGNSDLVFTFNYTQKTGSIDTMFISRESTVCESLNENLGVKSGVAGFPVPAFTSTKYQKGQIIVSFSYNNIDSNKVNISNGICNAKADTSVFRFCLQDNSGNLSDTIKSPKIVFVN